MGTTARNERRKLTANLLNALASGILLGAFVAPYISVALGQMPPNVSLPNLIGLSAFGVVLAIVLHLIALRQLANLED